MWKRFIPQNFNDLLSLVGLAIITALWILHGKQVVSLDDVIIGATIVTWTLLFNFYFRRAPKNNSKGE
jgi:branched-subunit amino acid transport protein